MIHCLDELYKNDLYVFYFNDLGEIQTIYLYSRTAPHVQIEFSEVPYDLQSVILDRIERYIDPSEQDPS